MKRRKKVDQINLIMVTICLVLFTAIIYIWWDKPIQHNRIRASLNEVKIAMEAVREYEHNQGREIQISADNTAVFLGGDDNLLVVPLPELYQDNQKDLNIPKSWVVKDGRVIGH